MARNWLQYSLVMMTMAIAGCLAACHSLTDTGLIDHPIIRIEHEETSALPIFSSAAGPGRAP